ncbi:subunit 17 of mediator complex-domain-containing protein [Roridomyces roridus]|uniref:Mediator of RNA polymerase II transcription subunit 17 n=1 Tax=Roridomyces roridus TaxID=1738132 RepID=A0AAD7C4T9_9AGAR|nr:subunit 17 of mediator complex-domain-containing protein [Roridomyces roridus]
MSIMLKLERPYKDDAGNRLPVLLDIAPDGTRVYEPEQDPQKSLAERLRRVFAERGVDFFDRDNGQLPTTQDTDDDDTDQTPGEAETDAPPGPMTSEELYKMRVEVLPQLSIALGEMMQAKELLSLLLASSPASSGPATSLAGLVNAITATAPLPGVTPAAPTPSLLSATTVTKPSPILSVAAFNAQLTLGGKDEALRKAAGVFKSAAESMERARIRGEHYWVDALKIRRANWGLIPAPLPFGAPTGKGADRTSKDFLISFGLEESSPLFRRRAVGRMPTYEQPGESLVFPYRQNMRLFISVSSISEVGTKKVLSRNTMPAADTTSLDGALRVAQQEIVEQEIFSFLVKEAGSLPTASARVSERLIVIEAAPEIELKFELLDADSVPSAPPLESTTKCDLIYYALRALLLRIHSYAKTQRLGTAGIFHAAGTSETATPPLLLRPIIDLLQYEVFCNRLRTELVAMRAALTGAGIAAALRFEPIGGTGLALVDLIDRSEDDQERAVGGEAVMRIDARHTVRLTFRSPSLLTAHLSLATLQISSIPQLRQLLGDEVERCLLQRICEVGGELCESVGGIWFVDLSRCVGRWEGCVLNFRVVVGEQGIKCTAVRMGKTGLQEGMTYSSLEQRPLLDWARQTIQKALLEP